MNKFIRTNVPRPKLGDSLEFIKKGYYTIGKEKHVLPRDRIKDIEELKEQLKRLLKEEIPINRNLDLVILKCHLLVEFMINQYITLSSVHKFDISNEKFSFAQKLSLAHAFGFPPDPILLPSMEVLNRIRNQVAHTLYLDRTLIDTLLRIHSDDPESFNVSNDHERIRCIKSITRFLCGSIMGVIFAQHSTAYEAINKNGHD
jgi:hypothetical protein